MKFVFHKDFVCSDLLSPVMVSMMMLVLLQGAYTFTGLRDRSNHTGTKVESTEFLTDHEQHLQPGDTTPSNSGDRRDCFQNGVITVEVQSLKFLRLLFNMVEFTNRDPLNGYWYASLSHQIYLPPCWSPSIPIAYRRLVI
jgi:hypothetical protein